MKSIITLFLFTVLATPEDAFALGDGSVEYDFQSSVHFSSHARGGEKAGYLKSMRVDSVAATDNILYVNYNIGGRCDLDIDEKFKYSIATGGGAFLIS